MEEMKKIKEKLIEIIVLALLQTDVTKRLQLKIFACIRCERTRRRNYINSMYDFTSNKKQLRG